MRQRYNYLPFTLFSLGFFRFALAEALREAEAKMADAAFLLYPPFLAIFFATALKLIYDNHLRVRIDSSLDFTARAALAV